MKAARSVLPALLLGLLWLGQVGGVSTPSPPPMPVGWQGKLASLLPEAGQNAMVMQWQPRLSTVQLQVMVARAGGSPEALQQVIISAAKGIRAPYDPRLGITEDQYRSYLVFQPSLTSTGKALKLPVLRDSSRVVFGDAPPLNGVLKGLSIDLKTGELRVPEGYAARPVALVGSTAPDRSLDVKTGFQWSVLGSNATVGNGVRGALMLLQLGNGQVVLIYKRTSMLNHQVTTGEITVGYTP